MAASASRSAFVTGLSSALLSMMSFDLRTSRDRGINVPPEQICAGDMSSYCVT